jgi:hypothetical protein
MKHLKLFLIFVVCATNSQAEDKHVFGKQNDNNYLYENNNLDKYAKEHTFGSSNPIDDLGNYPPIPGFDYQTNKNAPALPNNDDYDFRQIPNSQQDSIEGYVYPPFNYNSPKNIWQYAPMPKRYNENQENPANPWRPRYRRY